MDGGMSAARPMWHTPGGEVVETPGVGWNGASTRRRCWKGGRRSRTAQLPWVAAVMLPSRAWMIV